MHLCAWPPAHGVYRYTLDDIAWDESTLRLMIHKMMDEHSVTALYLVKEWDRNGDGELEAEEFLTHLHAFFRESEKLWRREVEPVAHKTFDRYPQLAHTPR